MPFVTRRAHLFRLQRSDQKKYRSTLTEMTTGMQIGSIAYMASLVLVALGAVAGGLLLEIRPLLWCAVIIGVYVLHLLSVHVAAGRTALGSAISEVESRERILEREREELERLRRELERRTAQTEEQWVLLRSMVQERVARRSGTRSMELVEPEPDLPAHSTGGISGGRVSRARPEADETGRTYGRW